MVARKIAFDICISKIQCLSCVGIEIGPSYIFYFFFNRRLRRSTNGNADHKLLQKSWSLYILLGTVFEWRDGEIFLSSLALSSQLMLWFETFTSVLETYWRVSSITTGTAYTVKQTPARHYLLPCTSVVRLGFYFAASVSFHTNIFALEYLADYYSPKIHWIRINYR